MKNKMEYLHSELTKKIIKSAFVVFDNLGTGFLESVYEKSLQIQLNKFGFFSRRQKAIKVYYGKDLVGDFRVDLIVEDLVIVEIKAVEVLHEIHEVQLVNYLRATDIEVGLLINLGKELQFKRKVFTNNLKSNRNRK